MLYIDLLWRIQYAFEEKTCMVLNENFEEPVEN